MKQLFIIQFLLMTLSLHATAQNKADQPKRPVNYFLLPFETRLQFTGKLNNEIPYWVGFDHKKYFDDKDIETVLRRAATHIAALKDSLNHPYTQKKLRIVLFADDQTMAFNLRETDNGKEFTFYNGAYMPLKTSYDTLEIVQLKNNTDNNEFYVLYTFSLKDINDLEATLSDTQLKDVQNILADHVKNKSVFWNNLYTDVAFGASVNSSIPIAPYMEVGYYYAFNKNNVGTNIVGLHLSTLLGIKKDTVVGITNFGIAFGSAKIAKGTMVQKASLIVGVQLSGKLGKTDDKPCFLLGLSFPATNNFSAGLLIGTDFKTNYEDPNRKSNLGVTFTYHL